MANLIEWSLIGIHVALLIIGEFTEIAWANALYDPGLIIAFIPLVAVAGGRWWPFILALPITLVPIAGKTVRTLVYDDRAIGPIGGWSLARSGGAEATSSAPRIVRTSMPSSAASSAARSKFSRSPP